MEGIGKMIGVIIGLVIAVIMVVNVLLPVLDNSTITDPSMKALINVVGIIAVIGVVVLAVRGFGLMKD